ncbi:MAG: hypothetical protein NDI94_05440 [Candidatus Woesearchaeota archaeon]|nr:hypothetical protein [Candidatus Woesearchaeota archaeon]
MKLIPRIIFNWFIGFLVFLLIVFVLNKVSIDIPIYPLIVDFIDANLFSLIMMSIFFMIADVFFQLHMPFNLPSPLFSGAAAVMLTAFIIRMILFVEGILGIQAVSELSFAYDTVYLIVFVVVIVSGYFRLFTRKDLMKMTKKEVNKK